MSQTSVSLYQAIASEGELADTVGAEIVSAIVGSGGIKPGRFCLIDSGVTPSSNGIGDPPTVKLPGSSANVTGVLAYGFVLANPAHEKNSSDVFTYSQYEVAPVLREGEIWMLSESAITAIGTQVYVRYTANGSADPGEVGCVRADDDSTKAVALPGAFFMSTCLAGGLVKVSFKPRR